MSLASQRLRSVKRRSLDLRIVEDHFRRGFARFKLRAHFLDLRSLLFELGRESLYLFLLQRDRHLQPLNFAIEHGLLCALRNVGLGGFGRKSTRVGSSGRGRTQPSIGIDEHGRCRVSSFIESSVSLVASAHQRPKQKAATR
jgi:hypothetical protein